MKKMNKKNKGFSIIVSLATSLILIGVTTAIIVSMNRSLEQANNIDHANKAFFALESGKEAALFHHNSRGIPANLAIAQDEKISHTTGAETTWEIKQIKTEEISGVMHENEKITIPLFWDTSTTTTSSTSSNTVNMSASERQKLELKFGLDDNDFQFGETTTDGLKKVLIVWSISRKNASGDLETLIPIEKNGNPCEANSSFFCIFDLPNVTTNSVTKHFTAGTIDFSSTSITGKVLPTGGEMSLYDFMRSNSHSDYQISFQPVLAFSYGSGSTSEKIAGINYSITGLSNSQNIPSNIYEVVAKTKLGDSVQTETYLFKENPAIGAFDYTIFR